MNKMSNTEKLLYDYYKEHGYNPEEDTEYLDDQMEKAFEKAMLEDEEYQKEWIEEAQRDYDEYCMDELYDDLIAKESIEQQMAEDSEHEGSTEELLDSINEDLDNLLNN